MCSTLNWTKHDCSSICSRHRVLSTISWGQVGTSKSCSFASLTVCGTNWHWRRRLNNDWLTWRLITFWWSFQTAQIFLFNTYYCTVLEFLPAASISSISGAGKLQPADTFDLSMCQAYNWHTRASWNCIANNPWIAFMLFTQILCSVSKILIFHDLYDTQLLQAWLVTSSIWRHNGIKE